MKHVKISDTVLAFVIMVCCCMVVTPMAGAQTQGAVECNPFAVENSICTTPCYTGGVCKNVDGAMLCLDDAVDPNCGAGYVSCNEFDGVYSEGEVFGICGIAVPTSITCTNGGPAWPCSGGFGGATAITLKSFVAAPGNSRVTLLWETSDESENLGFNLYRADSQDGEYVKINQAIIASEMGTGLGTKYKFIDAGVDNFNTYYYTLEDVDVYGIETLHSPVQSASPNPLFAIIDLIIDLFFP